MLCVFVCNGQCSCSQPVLSVLCVANMPMSVCGEFSALWLHVVWCVVEGVVWMVCCIVVSVWCVVVCYLCLIVVHGLCTLCHIMSCVGCRFCSSEVAGGFVVVVDHCVCVFVCWG